LLLIVAPAVKQSCMLFCYECSCHIIIMNTVMLLCIHSSHW